MTLVVTTALAGLTAFQKNTELETAKEQLAVAKDQKDAVRLQAETLAGSLKATQEELDLSRRVAIDQTDVAIQAFRKGVAEESTDLGRRILIQSWARTLRDMSERQTPPISINQKLPSGLSERARALSGVLTKYPLVVDLNRVVYPRTTGRMLRWMASR